MKLWQAILVYGCLIWGAWYFDVAGWLVLTWMALYNIGLALEKEDV